MIGSFLCLLDMFNCVANERIEKDTCFMVSVTEIGPTKSFTMESYITYYWLLVDVGRD